MKIMKAHLLLFMLCVVVPQYIFAAEVEFPRNLKFGMHGEDVRAMQEVLNNDPDTQIMKSGAGSPGNETDYFGLATKRALIKFQEKYRDEILAPFDLVYGNGFFGAKTRAKFTVVRHGVDMGKSPASAVILSPAATTSSSVAVHVEQGDVFVMSLSQYSGKPGTMLTMSGAGFTHSDNTIYFDTVHAVEHASSADEQTISFEVPAIPKGLHHLFVKNARGGSDHEAFFVVTDGVTPEPKIESVTYMTNKNIILRGSGFTANGNMVRTGVGVYEGVPSSDGKTIIVAPTTAFGNISSLPMATIFAPTPKELKQLSLPVSVYVINEDGISNKESFTLEL